VRGDPLQFRRDDAEVLCAPRDLDGANLLGGEHVRELAGHRRHVVGLRGDGRVLRVGQRLGQLFMTAVQVADDRVHGDDRFALERQDGAEDAVRRWMLRPHVDHEALAAGVVEFDLGRGLGQGHRYGGCGVSTA
jgi:hypothetical protein